MPLSVKNKELGEEFGFDSYNGVLTLGDIDSYVSLQPGREVGGDDSFVISAHLKSSSHCISSSDSEQTNVLSLAGPGRVSHRNERREWAHPNSSTAKYRERQGSKIDDRNELIETRGNHKHESEDDPGGQHSPLPGGAASYSSSSDCDSDGCIICSESFRNLYKHEIGFLDDCSHVFCYNCISSWANRTNVCPLCKREFDYIRRVTWNQLEAYLVLNGPAHLSESTGFVGKRRLRKVRKNCIKGLKLLRNSGNKWLDLIPSSIIKVEPKKLRLDSQLDNAGCEACGLDNDWDRLLLCDGCDLGYHIYCLRPPLARIPRGNWYCRRCRRLRRAASRETVALDSANVANPNELSGDPLGPSQNGMSSELDRLSSEHLEESPENRANQVAQQSELVNRGPSCLQTNQRATLLVSGGNQQIATLNGPNTNPPNQVDQLHIPSNESQEVTPLSNTQRDTPMSDELDEPYEEARSAPTSRAKENGPRDRKKSRNKKSKKETIEKKSKSKKSRKSKRPNDTQVGTSTSSRHISHSPMTSKSQIDKMIQDSIRHITEYLNGAAEPKKRTRKPKQPRPAAIDDYRLENGVFVLKSDSATPTKSGPSGGTDMLSSTRRMLGMWEPNMITKEAEPAHDYSKPNSNHSNLFRVNSDPHESEELYELPFKATNTPSEKKTRKPKSIKGANQSMMQWLGGEVRASTANGPIYIEEGNTASKDADSSPYRILMRDDFMLRNEVVIGDPGTIGGAVVKTSSLKPSESSATIRRARQPNAAVCSNNTQPSFRGFISAKEFRDKQNGQIGNHTETQKRGLEANFQVNSGIPSRLGPMSPNNDITEVLVGLSEQEIDNLFNINSHNSDSSKKQLTTPTNKEKLSSFTYRYRTLLGREVGEVKTPTERREGPFGGKVKYCY